MITKEQLREGIEWISGKTRITVDFDGNYLDVILYPNYPNTQTHISLFLGINGHRVKVTDLVGNGHGSGLQGKGYGTQIFNVGIQALYALFGFQLGTESAKDISLSGTVSSIGDPDSEPEKSACRDRRNGFWAGFGFQVREPLGYHTSMKAVLSDLKLKDGRATANGASRIIDLNSFWDKSEKPLVFQEDIDALIQVDLEQFELDNCPKVSDIERAWDASIICSKVIRNITWISLSTLVAYASFAKLDLPDAISITFSGLIASYLLAFFVDNRLWLFLPPYKRYRHLQEKRGDTISRVKKYIQDIEQSHNGLLWRLREIIPINGSDRVDVLEELLEASKKQYFFKISDHYIEYKYFIDAAKKVIGKESSDVIIY